MNCRKRYLICAVFLAVITAAVLVIGSSKSTKETMEGTLVKQVTKEYKL